MNALLSRSLGAKEQDKADQAANTGIFLAFCSFAVFCLIGVFFSHTFFRMQTDVAEIVNYGTIYGRVCLGCSIGLFCQFTFERLLQSTGRTHLSMCTQMLGALLNIALDPILIFGLFGCPPAGGRRCRRRHGHRPVLRRRRRLHHEHQVQPRHPHLNLEKVRWHRQHRQEHLRDRPALHRHAVHRLRDGVWHQPASSSPSPTTAAAVFGAYFKLQSFIFMPVFGLNNGMVPIIAYNYGARKPDRVKKTIKLAVCAAMCIMAVGIALFELVPQARCCSFFDASAGHAGHRHPCPADHRHPLPPGRVLHHRRVRVPGHRQPDVQPDRLRLPPAGGAAAGGVAPLPDR